MRWEPAFALHPTHLLLLPTQAEPAGLRAAHGLGVKTLILEFSGLKSIPAGTRRLGAFLDRAEKAEVLARTFEEALTTLPRVSAERTAYVLWWSPPVTAGPSSFIGEGLAGLGLDAGPPSEAEFPALSAEALLAWNPTLILYPSDAGPPPAWMKAGTGVRFLEVPADRWNRPALDFPAALRDLGYALVR